MEKQCSRCKKTKSIELFEDNRRRCNDCCYCIYCKALIKTGACKSCTKKCSRCKEDKIKNEYSEMSDKICIKCKNHKNVSEKRYCKYCKQTKNKQDFEGNRQRCNDCSYCAYCKSLIPRAGSLCSTCIKTCKICKKNKKIDEYDNITDRNCTQCKSMSKNIDKDKKECITCQQIKNKEDFEKDCQRCISCYYCSYCKLPIKRGNICIKCSKQCIRCKQYKRNNEYSTLNDRICTDCKNKPSSSKKEERCCSSCKKLKSKYDFKETRHRCNECCYCKTCESFIEIGNICVKCNKKCVHCHKFKEIEEFDNKNKRICKECKSSLTCNKCKIPINEENKVSTRNLCKKCELDRHKQVCSKKIIEVDRVCITCNKQLSDTYFKGVYNKECIQCYNVKRPRLSKEEYDTIHLDEKRECKTCKEIKPTSNNFNYHTNSYRNICNVCINNSRLSDLKRRYNSFLNTKITTQEFTTEELKEFKKQFQNKPCFYCNCESTGIDRLDSDYNYSYQNCVSCCVLCNKMKKDMDIASFVRKTYEIYINIYSTNEEERALLYHKDIKLMNRTGPCIKNYMKKAEERKLEFLLTYQEFEDITNGSCVFCNVTPSRGIDRINNNIGYYYDNCQSCCKYCNYMKNNHEQDKFLNHISNIYKNTKSNEYIHELCLKAKYKDIRDINSGNNKPKQVPSLEKFTDYLLGFIDSCISIGTSGGYVSLKINHEDKKYLSALNNQFKDIFTINGIGHLIVTQKDKCKVFLEAYKASITKNKHIEICKDILSNKERNKKCIELRELNEVKSPGNLYNLTAEYIAGVFDAHGYLKFDNGYIDVVLSHHNQDILHSIYNIIGGCITDGKLIIKQRTIKLQFLISIAPYVIYKKNQIDRAIDSIETCNVGKFFETTRLYKNIGVDKFQKLLIKIKQYSPKELLLYNKYKELQNIEKNPVFDNMVYTDFTKIEELKPRLVFCESKELHELWLYYRDRTSSICHSGSIGRCVRILVIDEISSKYIGIMSLSSDLYHVSQRDEFVQYAYPELMIEDYINYVVNLSTCVPLQPFGSNCNGGKLLVKLAFTREVFDYWLKKYKQPFFIIDTMSINGKSIQYDRLKELKESKRLTKGISAYHIPQEIIDISCYLCKKLNIETRRPGKMERLNALLSYLKIEKDILKHSIQKGVYTGWLFSTKLDKNYNPNELKTVEEKTKEWYTRWCINRMDKMKKDGRFSENLSLYSKDSPQFDEVKHIKIL